MVGPGPERLTELISSSVLDPQSLSASSTLVEKTSLTPAQARRLCPAMARWIGATTYERHTLPDVQQTAEQLPVGKTRLPAGNHRKPGAGLAVWCHGAGPSRRAVGPERGQTPGLFQIRGWRRWLPVPETPDRFPYRHPSISYRLSQMAVTLFGRRTVFTRGANPQTHDFLETPARICTEHRRL